MKPEGMSEERGLDKMDAEELRRRYRVDMHFLGQERDSLASKLAVAVEALRWYADEEQYVNRTSPPFNDYGALFDGGHKARTALAAVERKEGAGE